MTPHKNISFSRERILLCNDYGFFLSLSIKLCITRIEYYDFYFENIMGLVVLYENKIESGLITRRVLYTMYAIIKKKIQFENRLLMIFYGTKTYYMPI